MMHDDEWLPQKLRLCFLGSDDSGPGGGTPSGDFTGGGELGGSNFGTDTSSSNFGTDTSGSSTDGGGFQSTSSSFSDSGGYTGGDYSGSYQGSDTGGGYYGYSGTDGGGAYFGGDSTGGGYLGGSSLGGNVAADAYGGGSQTAGSPFGGGGGFQGPGGFNDSTTGQGFGNFNTSQADQNNGQLPAGTLDALINTNNMPTINISAPYEGALSGPDVMAGGRGPSLSDQLGINDVGRNTSDPLSNYLDSNMQVQTNEPTNAWQQAVNTVSQLNMDPQAQMIAAQELGRQDQANPTAGQIGNFNPGRTGAFEQEGFNPNNTYQAPSQLNQGTQGLQGGRSEAPSLMDMLTGRANAQPLDPYMGIQRSETLIDPTVPVSPTTPMAPVAPPAPPAPPANPFNISPGNFNLPTADQVLNAINPIGRAEAQNLWNIDPVTGQMQQQQDNFNARFGDLPQAPTFNPGQQLMGSQQFAPAQPFGANPLAGRGDTFDARFGGPYSDPAAPTSSDPFAEMGQTGSRSGDVTGARGDTFASRFGDPQQQSQQTQDTFESRFAGDNFNPAQLMAGVRGGSEMFNQAPQSLNEALQAARSGDPNVMAPPFAQMPWGTTFAPPNANQTPNMANMLFQTQNTDRPPTQTLQELRDEQLQQEFNNRTMFDPTLFGPPQTFQAPPSREAPPNVPLPTANPLNPFERGDVNERPATLERGIDPQNRDAVARTIERAVTERAPVVEREQSRPPLQVTVPGRTAQTQSRSADTRSQSPNASRGQLDSLLAQARTAPTLAGRIAALDQLNGIISAMRAAGLPNPYGRDPDPGINAALRQGR